MTQSGRTPPTRKERRAAERATSKAPAVTPASTPAWRSPIALISLGAVVVGVVIIAVLALGSSTPDAAPIQTPPVAIAEELRDGRSLGDPDAPVQLEVFEDPQCPVCGRFTRELEPLLVASYIKDGTVRFTYRDFVFIGAESQDAAVGMRAAEQLADGFWDFQGLVYENQDGENQGAFSRDRLGEMAQTMGLDKTAFLALLDDPALIAGVAQETAAGQALGINSTPTVVVNGTVRPGLPTWDELSALIEAQAALVSPAPASAAPGASTMPAASNAASAAP